MNENSIDLLELKQRQKDGSIIIDVRSKEEYEKNHIIGAINIPEYEIEYKITKLIKDKNDEIILYCTYGTRSKDVMLKLNNMGFENVYYIRK